MKRLSSAFIVILIFSSALWAKSKETAALHTGIGTHIANPVPDEDNPEHWASIEELVEHQKQNERVGFVSNWGISVANITRIQSQSGRSNFVWNDKLVGAYYELCTTDFLNMGRFIKVNLFARNGFYYPYGYTFNKVPQVTTQTLLYNFDFFTGAKLSVSIKDWVLLSLKPGFHLSYQLHDKFHYVSIGAGFGAEVEVPISSRWSMNIGGIWTWDNANLGSNRRMRPFDYAWEYQAQIGFRYSKKHLNVKSFIPYKPKPPKKAKKVHMVKKKADADTETAGAAAESDDASAGLVAVSE